MLNLPSYHCCGPFAADDSKSDRRRKLEDMALAHLGWRFDRATCLLTFHSVPREERVPMAAEIRRRLKLGAPLVVADCAGAGGEGGARKRDLWLSRYAAFQVASDVPPEPRLGRGTRLLRSWLCCRWMRMRRFFGRRGSAICGCFIWGLRSAGVHVIVPISSDQHGGQLRTQRADDT